MLGSILITDKRFFSSLQPVDRPRGPPSLLFSGYRWLISWEGVKLTTQCIYWCSYTSAVHTFSWRGAKCKAVPYFKPLFTGFSPRRLDFHSMSGRVEICDGRNGTGPGFLRVPRLPLLVLIPPTAPRSSVIVTIRVWYSKDQ
jgi:hypothetical protein